MQLDVAEVCGSMIHARCSEGASRSTLRCGTPAGRGTDRRRCAELCSGNTPALRSQQSGSKADGASANTRARCHTPALGARGVACVSQSDTVSQCATSSQVRCTCRLAACCAQQAVGVPPLVPIAEAGELHQRLTQWGRGVSVVGRPLCWMCECWRSMFMRCSGGGQFRGHNSFACDILSSPLRRHSGQEPELGAKKGHSACAAPSSRWSTRSRSRRIKALAFCHKLSARGGATEGRAPLTPCVHYVLSCGVRRVGGNNVCVCLF